MKNFTNADIQSWNSSIDGHLMHKIYAEREDLIEAPMWYHLKGLSETSSGYGRKLNSGLKISFNSRQYRLYVTIFSNSGTMWFKVKGQKIIVS